MRILPGIFFTLLVLMSACGAPDSTLYYTIRLTLDQMHEPLYAVKIDHKGEVSIDTLRAMEGRYLLEGESDSILNISLYLGEQTHVGNFSVSNGDHITIDGNIDPKSTLRIEGATERNTPETPPKAKNERLPFFQLKNQNDSTFNSSSLSGKNTIIYLWAPFGPLSALDTDTLRHIRRRYSPKELTMVSIALESDTALWRAALNGRGLLTRSKKNKLNAPWLQLHTPEGVIDPIVSTLKINHLPTVIITDTAGIVIYRGHSADGLSTRLSHLITQ